jgi:hypothetical protein
LKTPLKSIHDCEGRREGGFGSLRNEDKRCIAKLPDPYYSIIIQGATSKVMVGSHYDSFKKVDLTLEQAYFFFY